MELTEQEGLFVERRRRLANSWSMIGSIMLIGLVLLFGRLFLSNPLLVNPWTVLGRLDAGSLSSSTISLMAGLLPVMSLTSLFIVVAVLIMSFAAFSNEKRHIVIIYRLASVQGGIGETGHEKGSVFL